MRKSWYDLANKSLIYPSNLILNLIFQIVKSVFVSKQCDTSHQRIIKHASIGLFLDEENYIAKYLSLYRHLVKIVSEIRSLLIYITLILVLILPNMSKQIRLSENCMFCPKVHLVQKQSKKKLAIKQIKNRVRQGQVKIILVQK